MNKVEWKRKLSSRKLWALIAALATTCMVLFGVDSPTQVKIAALITQTGAVVAYVLSEGYVDGKVAEGGAAQQQISAGGSE